MGTFRWISLLKIDQKNFSMEFKIIRDLNCWALFDPETKSKKLQKFLTDQLTLSQLGGADYAHHSTTSPPGFSDLATGLSSDKQLKSEESFIFSELQISFERGQF